MNYRIRNAAPGDISEIVRLCGEHAEFEAAEFSPEGKAEKLELLLFSDNPSLFCLIVESDGEIAGYATFMKELSTWQAGFYIHMDCLFLRPPARNRGIGAELIKEIARRAQAMKCNEMQWQTPVANERALNFYRRLGASSKVKVRLYLDEATITKLAG
ncbi:MAG TPA: GNAT family N-acetyltransferase [Pyrinomonadaceae bacterium]|jgi:ribosomal protein S18 acetylase RimI-like enzyme|nr:GNAT family N-acetyltransferase [Pyrinomonadaceae bacterium]